MKSAVLLRMSETKINRHSGVQYMKRGSSSVPAAYPGDLSQSSQVPAPKRIIIGGLHVDLFNKNQLLETIYSSARKDETVTFGYANVHTFNLAVQMAPLRRYFEEQASFVFCDGVGLLLGARMLGYRVRAEHRLTAPDFFDSLANGCAKRGLNLYLLAGRPGVVEMAIEKLRREYPVLSVSGHHGYFHKEDLENEHVLTDIIERRTNVLCVGFGSPMQEEWIVRNKERLDGVVLIPLGAWLEFYTGATYRGPRWLTDNGLEWLCRLFTEPRRLWRRYLVGNPQFFARVLREKLILILDRFRKAE
jgi:N-acetylglucosaminyldiphosphoundecaprenol N-acetyl-beta-D-mannosaminyltransferase